MNPITLLNAIVGSYAEGERKKMFGADYRERQALQAVQAEKLRRSIPLDEQRAATEAQLAQGQIAEYERKAREAALDTQAEVEGAKLEQAGQGPQDPDAPPVPQDDLIARFRAAQADQKRRLDAEATRQQITSAQERSPNFAPSLTAGARGELGITGEEPVNSASLSVYEKAAEARRSLTQARTVAGIQAAARPQMNAFGLTPVQALKETNSMARLYNLQTKAGREVGRQFDIMKGAYDRMAASKNADLNATTQTIITTFNKIMDPSSVVRESEYVRSPQGQALLQTLEGKFNALSEGGPGVTRQSLKEFVDLASIFNARAQESLQAERARVTALAQDYGLDPARIVGGDDSSTHGAQAGAAGAGEWEDMGGGVRRRKVNR